MTNSANSNTNIDVLMEKVGAIADTLSTITVEIKNISASLSTVSTDNAVLKTTLEHLEKSSEGHETRLNRHGAQIGELLKNSSANSAQLGNWDKFKWILIGSGVGLVAWALQGALT